VLHACCILTTRVRDMIHPIWYPEPSTSPSVCGTSTRLLDCTSSVSMVERFCSCLYRQKHAVSVHPSADSYVKCVVVLWFIRYVPDFCLGSRFPGRMATNLENPEYSGISLNMENSGNSQGILCNLWENCNKQSVFSSSFKYLCKTAVDLLYCQS